MKKMLSVFVRRTLGVFVAAFMAAYTLHAQQAPSIEWAKCFGGSGDDKAYSIQQTSDGGFIVAGSSCSYDDDVTGNHPNYDSTASDYWIVRLDSSGNLMWQKCLGGSCMEIANSIQQTADGGFIVVGTSCSDDGDVSGIHIWSGDYWVVKLDSAGDLLWQRCLGGGGSDLAYSIQQTTDGGFIIAGTSNSYDGDVSGNHCDFYGNNTYDVWIVKLDNAGNLVWQKCLGWGSIEKAYSIQQTSDKGFIVAGTSYWDFYDYSNYNFLVMKLDSVGNLLWSKILGGSKDDNAFSVKQTFDGGFIIAGGTSSDDGYVSGNHGGSFPDDFWIVKLDSAGNFEWQKCLGGSSVETARCLQQTTDHGFIIAGESGSNDGDVSGHYGSFDYWIVKLDSIGNLVWQKSLGGTYDDYAQNIQQTTEGGFIIAGTASSNDGNVSGNHSISLSYGDYWIVKLSPEILSAIPPAPSTTISLHPNPVQNLLTIDLATQAANATIRVYDLQGKMIALPTTCTNTQAQLNTAALPAGFYTLQITNTKTGLTEVGKFVKED